MNRVLSPGRGDLWWWTDAGPAWSDDEGCWLLQGEQRQLWSPPRFAVSSRRARRNGVELWVSEGWLYRRCGNSTRALGRSGDRITAGPEGAVLIGREDRWTEGAAGRSGARHLDSPLVDSPWGLRWSEEGRFVAGLDEDGAGVRLDLSTGELLERHPDALPVDASGRWLHQSRGEIRLGDQVIFRGVLEASPGRHQWLLGGPGGVCWDLRSGRRLFEEPSLLLGATAATADRWATVHWDTGVGHWFDPLTGRVLQHFELPIDEVDVVDGGWAEGDSAVFVTADLHAWRVVGEQIEAVTYREPQPDEQSVVVEGVRYRWDGSGQLLASRA